MQCPDCGRKYNDPEVRFCPFCTIPLVDASASPPPPRAARHSLAGEGSTPPPVVVEVRREEKRRLNPLWLLLILLLLLVCCCGLLVTEQVEVPEFASPYVAPFLEDMREAFNGFIGPQRLEKNVKIPKKDAEVNNVEGCEDLDVTCEEFREMWEKILPWWGGSECDEKECIIIWGNLSSALDPKIIECMEFYYQWWKKPPRAKSDCNGNPTDFRCTIPNVQTDRCLQQYLGFGECEPFDWQGQTCEELMAKKEPKDRANFNLFADNNDCCPDLEVTYTGYINPTVLRLLEIDIACENGAWNIDDGDCVDGEVFVGEDQNIPWTDVECCLSDDELHCESPGTVDQKKSWSKLEMVGDTCSSEVFFQSPYYEQGEPVEEEECPPGCECSPGSPPYCPGDYD